VENFFVEEGPSARPPVSARPLGPSRRAERPPGPKAPAFPAEIAFLALYGGLPHVLMAASEAARRCGVPGDEALLGEGLMHDEVFYALLAKHVKAPFYRGETAVAADVDAARAIASGIAPLAPNEHGLSYLLAPRAQSLSLLLEAAKARRFPVKVAIASPRRFGACVRAAAARRIAEASAFALKEGDRSLSAHKAFSGRQIAVCGLLAMSTVALSYLNPAWLTAMGSTALWACFSASIGLRAIATAASRFKARAPALSLERLPIYSIVVPLSREVAIIDRLIRALDAIAYPRAKLDIKIIVEADDVETMSELARRRLPARYDVIVAAPGAPRTKPRALNVALPFLRGRYAVVYDAEDSPAPSQLRLAAARFEAEPGLGCLQARLVVDNVEDSWLTRVFAIEYSALFDVINPGLAAIGAPIALGGSSNHFRTQVLRRVGGWDAWNVTEDADLGLRLARFGVRVAALDSDTYEEQPATFRRWFNQRRRWHKGWIQTALVVSRSPIRLTRELGPIRALCAGALIGGAILGGLFGPPLTLWTLWRVVFGDFLNPHTFWDAMSVGMTGSVLIPGVAVVLASAVLGLRARRLHRLGWALALLPVYYCLICAAAWLSLIDFSRRPFHWSKTEHGLARTSQYARRRAAPAVDD
jgi:glycosyltransferase XagB